jgi:hypothetical protein
MPVAPVLGQHVAGQLAGGGPHAIGGDDVTGVDPASGARRHGHAVGGALQLGDALALDHFDVEGARVVEQSGIELFAPGDDRMKAAVPRQRKAHAVTAGGSNDNVVDRRPAGHSVGAKA